MSDLSDALKAAQKKRSGWSLRRISEEMSNAGHDVSFATIGVYLRGEHGAPEERVLEAFAAVFPELSMRHLRALAAQPPGEDDPYIPPAEANRLSRSQRAAVDAVISAMLEHRQVGDRQRRLREVRQALAEPLPTGPNAPVDGDLDQLEAAANRKKPRKP